MYIVTAVLAVYSVISVSYLNYLMMASETPWIYAMFGCKFTPGVEKCYHSFLKRRDPHKYMTSKVQEIRWCQLIHVNEAVFILVTP